MALKRAPGCPEKTNKLINLSPDQTNSFSIWLGIAMDPVGYFRRWAGVKSHPLRLSTDTHHGVLFWWQKCPGQRGPDRTRYLLYRRTGADKLVTGGYRRPYRKSNWWIASKFAGANFYRGHIDRLCHEPFWVLGIPASFLLDSSGFQNLLGFFWIIIHGCDTGRCGGALYRSIRDWAFNLGSNPG